MMDTHKLEALLIAQWTEFLDARLLLKQLGDHLGEAIRNLTISRFEMTDKGFLLWFETTAAHSKKRTTVEALLTTSKLEILRTEET